MGGSICHDIGKNLLKNPMVFSVANNYRLYRLFCSLFSDRLLGFELGGSYSYTEVRTQATVDTSNWSMDETTSTDDAANLGLRIYMENIGIAEAHNVTPTFTLYLGTKSIATITPAESAYTMPPNSRYPKTDCIVVNKDKDGNDITLSFNQLKSILSGTPLFLQVNQVSAEVPNIDRSLISEEEWSNFIGRIESSCIKLLVDSGQKYPNDGKNDHSYKCYYIFVGDETYTPKFTLRQVLSFVNLIEKRNDGKTYVDGREFPGDWLCNAGSEQVNTEWKSKLNNGENPLDLIVSKNAGSVVMFIPDGTNPRINGINISNDQRKLSVNITPGFWKIVKVEAEATTWNNINEKKTLDGPSDTLEYTNDPSPFQSSALTIDLIVTDDRGNVFRYSVDPFKFSKQPLTDSTVMNGDKVNIIPGDYNGDGKTDFIRQEKGDWDDDDIITAGIYLSNGDGTFKMQPLTDYTVMKGDLVNIIPGDYNGDGKTDFIRQEKGDDWVKDDKNTVQVYLSNGDGTFSMKDLTDQTSRNQQRFLRGDLVAIIPGDYNGDRKTDFIRLERGGWAGS